MARTKARETYGSGSVTPEKRNGKVVPDTWRVCISLGIEEYMDKQGRPRKRQKKIQRTVHGSLKDARAICKELVEKYEHIDTDASSMTFSTACRSWLSMMDDTQTCGPEKLRDYENILDQVAERLGAVPLAELRKHDVESALSTVKTARSLTQGRYRTYCQVVKRVFEYCLDNDWIVRNPCRTIKAPRVTEEPRREYLQPADCAILRSRLDHAEAAAYNDCAAKEERQADWGNTFNRGSIRGVSHMSGLMAVRLMLATGIRRGEALALTWEDIDIENMQIQVRHSLTAKMRLKKPKTKSGTRTISIDSDTAEHLGRWKDFQRSVLHRIKEDDGRGGSRSKGQSQRTPVCCNCIGGFLDPTNFDRWWRSYRADLGFGSLNVKDLRHTQATLLINNNTDIKTVQTRMGHSSARVTLDIYSHAMPANDRKAAGVIGDICDAGREADEQVIRLDESA